jgi:hypothetical protein
MKEVAGITIAAFVGGISYFLGLGFQIPPGGEGFRFFATFGGIAGFGVGSVLAKRIASYRILQLGILTFVIMLAGSAAALSYMLLIATGAAPGIALTVWLALLLTITFFCLGAVLPLAGLSFSAP